MVSKALLVQCESRPDTADEVDSFLRWALPVVQGEPGTVAWFALRSGSGGYGIFDAFPDDTARQAHLNGQVAVALTGRADELFAEPPSIAAIDVLANKLAGEGAPIVTEALLIRFKARSGKEGEVAEFLRDAESLVEEEPKTTAWFALDFGGGEFGIFDAFPDKGGRWEHLTGDVAKGLGKKAVSLFGGIPHMNRLEVLAHKLPS